MPDCDCPLPVVLKRENVYLGLKGEMRLCCLAKAIKTLTGQDLFPVEPTGRQENWENNQAWILQDRARQRREEAERAAKGNRPPEVIPEYVPKARPAWIAKRLS